MAEPTVIHELVCRRKECGHHWVPRSSKLPKVCPKCKHYDWNKSPWEVENEVNAESDEQNKKEEYT